MNGHTQVFLFDNGRFAILRQGGEGTENDPFRQEIIDENYMALAEESSVKCQTARKGLPDHCPCLACRIVAERQKYFRKQKTNFF